MNEVNFDRFVEAWALSWRPASLTAFSKFGYNSNADQAFIVSKLYGGMKGASKTFPVNRELLIYLRENKVSLLPYDADSLSKEMYDIAVFDMRRNYAAATIPKPDADMRMAIAKNVDARNLVMADNIISKFASYQCTEAVVVVGANHIATKGNIEWSHGVELDTYTPLQDRLQAKGLPSERVGWLLGQGKP